MDATVPSTPSAIRLRRITSPPPASTLGTPSTLGPSPFSLDRCTYQYPASSPGPPGTLCRHPNIIQDAVGVSPIGVHLDPKVQVHFRSKKRFEIQARFRPDSFDHLARASDHDGLLRFDLDDDRAIQRQQPV